MTHPKHMAATTRQIGLYGGSFNPIHTGHIALAQQLLRTASLDEVWLMVSPQNPLKQQAGDLLADERRLELARAALAHEPGIVACDYEFHLPRPSYTWNTLQALAADYPHHTFALIIGADNWAHFDRWHRAADILSHHRIIIYPRSGWPVEPAQLPPNITLVRTRLYDVSSTEIRRRVAEGQPITGLVPPCIEQQVTTLYAPKA